MDDQKGNSLKDRLPPECYEQGKITYISTSACGTVHQVTLGHGTHLEFLEVVDPTASIRAAVQDREAFNLHGNHGDGVKVLSMPTSIRNRMIREGWTDKELQRWADEHPEFKSTSSGWRFA